MLHAIRLFDWLWKEIKGFWVLVGAGVLVGLILTAIAALQSGETNPRSWLPVRLLLNYPWPVVGVVTVVLLLPFLAWLAHRSQLPASPYVLKRVERLDPTTNDFYVPRYVASAYLSRPADAEAREALRRAAQRTSYAPTSEPLGICIVGRPTQGKTRLAWEVMRAELTGWTFVKWSHHPPPFDFPAQRGSRVVLVIDDAQEYANEHEATTLTNLPEAFKNVNARLVIVMTCRDGDDLDNVRKMLGKLLERLTIVELTDIPDAQADQLAALLNGAGEAVQRDQFDNTPGSLLLGVARMRDERYRDLPEPAKKLLRALRMLRSARIYNYPAPRVRATAADLFHLGESDWPSARDALLRAGFLRLGDRDENGERTLAPVADVYLEQAVPDYPAPGAEPTDDWPALEQSLARHKDAAALISLGNAFVQSPPDHQGNHQQHAEACYRTALEIYSPQGIPVDWGRRRRTLSEATYDQIADVFRILIPLSRGDTEAATRLLLQLLPLLEDEHVPAGAEFAHSRCRDRLVELLEGFPAQVFASRRRLVLDRLLEQLQRCAGQRKPHLHQSVCWTIARIGYRQDDVVAALWMVVHRHPEDEQGDIALHVLAALGPQPSQRTHILQEAHQRATRRRSRALIQTLYALADPTSVDVVRNWLTSAQYAEDRLADDLCLGVLTHLADVQDGLIATTAPSAAPPTQIWRDIQQLLAQHRERFGPYEIHFRGDFASACASEEVVPTLLNRAAQETGESDEARRSRSLLYQRLEECVRPLHLAGWQRVDLLQQLDLLARLEADACHDTRSPGRWETSAGQAKKLAWQTALRLGYPGALEWFERGIAQETNPYLQGELCELLAAFRYEQVPEIVLEWVREPVELRQNPGGKYAVHKAALFLARSAATLPAFEALQHCGLVIDGLWVDEAVQSLGSVAVQLAQQGVPTIHTALLEQLLQPSKDNAGTAAAFALAELAAAHLLPMESEPLVSLILPLLIETSRSAYQRGLLIVLLGEVLFARTEPSPSLPEELKATLLQLARTDAEWPAWMALQTLALFNQLSAEEDLLIQYLCLQASGASWELPAQNDTEHRLNLGLQQQQWYARTLALLYRHEPERFRSPVIDLLADPSFRMIDPLVEELETLHLKQEQVQLPSELAEALVARLRNWPSGPFASLDLFRSAIHLAPDQFLQQPWSELVQDWTTEARAALANALGEVQFSSDVYRSAQAEHLLLLIRDGHYVVRRAAYRALGNGAPTILQQLCEAWAASPLLVLRRRAAEACAWLAEKDLSVRPLFAQLRLDEERVVREDALRVWRERRARLWAAEALTRLEPGTVWNNSAVFQRWRYGEALTQLGDDENFRTLGDFLGGQQVPQHVHFWFQQIIQRGEKHWEEVCKKWPEPWEAWKGTIQIRPGSLQGHGFSESQPIWLLSWQGDPAEQTNREGIIWSEQISQLTLAVEEEYRVVYRDGTATRMRVQQVGISGNSYLCKEP